MGKSERAECSFNRIKAAQEHHIGCCQKANRCRTASEVGEGEGAAEEGGLEPREPAATTTRQAFVSEVSRSAPSVAATEASVVDSPHNRYLGFGCHAGISPRSHSHNDRWRSGNVGRGDVESGVRNTAATGFRAAEPGNTPRQGRIGMLKQIGAYESPKTA